jgi:mannonate dehydratase
MYVGVQGIGTSKHELQFLRRHGVTHMDTSLDQDSLDEIVRQREAAAAEGVELEMIHIPIADSIVRGLDPQRDRDLDDICRWIENAGRGGLRGLNYNFSTVSYQRTETRYGRGGSAYSSFELTKYDNDEPHESGPVTRDEIFARIACFLERVIPVAEEYKVQMACHLPDPPAPVLRGEERWNYPVFDGLKRFSELVDNPYHGFNFCCGVASEGLDDPGKELPPIVEYFSERGKIFNVHFRNIRGHKLDFMEVFPDEGSIDMFRAIQTYQEVGYEYMLMPDHVPTISGPDPQGTAFAFCYGYITALLQAIGEPRKQPWVTKGP